MAKKPDPDENRSAEGPRVDADTVYERPSAADVDVPTGMSVEETVDWVSGDRARAQAALDAEGSEPRSTLVSALERLANDETGAGIASGEA